MIDFDSAQLRVLELDTGRHARIVGAPGTGKTRVLIEAFHRALAQPDWSEEDLLILAPNRLVSADLRREVERTSARAFGGTPVRTAASLGFAIEARRTALAGATAPRLLTGTVQDEAIAAVVEAGLSAGAGDGFALVPEVMQSPTFRAELRELWRVLDDFGVTPAELVASLENAAARAAHEAQTEAPASGLADRWLEILRLITAVHAQLQAERPNERSASELLAAAGDTARTEGGHGPDAKLRLPRLILVDDAQELGEGQLALLAACASVGTKVWVFGDPDLSTSAFQGEPTRVLSDLTGELARRQGVREGLPGVATQADPEQHVVLDTVHRHGVELREFVSGFARRIGVAGPAEHRSAESGVKDEAGVAAGTDDGAGAKVASEFELNAAEAAGVEKPASLPVQFAAVGTPAEQLGAIAHRLRARRLGVDNKPVVAWSDMAVICRSRTEASRVARVLAAHQVPTGVAAGGLVLREHQIVRELIRLLQHALGISELTVPELLQLLGGVTGGLDPVAVRRLRGALMMQERRDAREQDREAVSTEDLVASGFADPGVAPMVDSAGGRALRKLGLISSAGKNVAAAGGTARETLWAIWEGTRLAERWQQTALEGKGVRADEAHRSLDAVLGLFFALQRHEEQDREQPIEELLEELLESAVPEDSLAQKSRRDAVTVTTPQGAIGREFSVVAVVGVQDGAWPNLRARGSLLGATALERWLRGGAADTPSRRDTIHDELRLFVQACSRAKRELLVVAIADDDHHPSPFFRLGAEYRLDGLPSSRLTLRGATAEMRRQLTSGLQHELEVKSEQSGKAAQPDHADHTDQAAEAAEAASAAAQRVVAVNSLAVLACEDVPGAHPDDWYGVKAPSSTAPLVDLEQDPEALVPVSPSQLEKAEECALNWVISKLGGSSGNAAANLGTLVHYAMETVHGPDPEAMLQTVQSEWGKLNFDADWEAERAFTTATAMVEGIAAYLRDFEDSARTLVGTEISFQIPLGRAVLRGNADRIERRVTDSGDVEATVLDLKTGRNAPTEAATLEHAQLMAYQLGIVHEAFRSDDATMAELEEGATDPVAAELAGAASGGARLLYVHPEAAKTKDFVEKAQPPITDEARAAFEQRVQDIARVMSGGRFTARVEHHCTDQYAHGDCGLHIIQAVSHS